MCSLQLVGLSMRPRHVKYLIRACSLGAFALTGPLAAQATIVAAKAYNDLCFNEAPLWRTPDGSIWLSLGVGLVVLLPTICSRSSSVVVMNLFLSIVTLLLACRVQATAGTPPYECFSHNGTYEDRVSGLRELDLWGSLILIVLYVAFVVDWLVWFIRRMGAFLGLIGDSRANHSAGQ
jgi:hypothetical protein